MCDDADTPAQPAADLWRLLKRARCDVLLASAELAQNRLTAPMAGFDGVLLLSGVCGMVVCLFQHRSGPHGSSVLTWSLARMPPAAVTRAHAQLTPAVPHLLIHCRHGLWYSPLEAVLDVLLCSKQYAATEQRGLHAGATCGQRPLDSPQQQRPQRRAQESCSRRHGRLGRCDGAHHVELCGWSCVATSVRSATDGTTYGMIAVPRSTASARPAPTDVFSQGLAGGGEVTRRDTDS